MRPDARLSSAGRLWRRWPVFAVAVAAAWLSLAVVAPLESPSGAVLVVVPTLASWWLTAATLAALAAVVSGGTPALLPLTLLLLPVALPGVPAAWVYAGPGAVIVWFTVMAFAWQPEWPRWSILGRLRDSVWPAVLLGGLWLGGAALAVERVAMRGDAPHYLTITHSLVTDGDLDLRNDYDERTHRGFYAGMLEPRHTVTAVTGAEYSFHGIGVSLLVAPGYRWFGARGSTLTLVLLLAMGSGLLWAAARRLTREAGAAWFAWAALVLSAPFTLHASAIYPDGPAAVGVAAAVWLLVRLTDRSPVALGALVLASVGLAALPWLHVRLALPAGILGIAVIAGIVRSQPDRWTRVLWFMVVPTISCAGWLASTYVTFGTWNPAATMLQRTAPGPWGMVPEGIVGILVDQEFGLWPVAPVFIAAPLALLRLVRTAPLLAAGTAVTAGGVLLTSSMWGWWGGDSAPARFLTVVLPVLSLWLADVWAHVGTSARRVLALGLGWSAAATTLLALVDNGSYAYNHPDGAGAIFSAYSSSVDVGAALPSMFRAGAALATELPLAIVWCCVLLPAAWLVVAHGGGTRARARLVALVVVLAPTVAAGLAWGVRGVQPWTPGTAQRRVLASLASNPAYAAAFSPRQGLIRGNVAALLRLRTPESVPRTPDVLLHVPNVPAGRFAVRVERGRSPYADLTVELGREAAPYARWRASAPPPVITLARGVHSLRVMGPPDAVSDLWLAAVDVVDSGHGTEARRVTKLGTLDVYAMDDNLHADGDGFWTGGDRATTAVLATTSPRLVTLRLTGGPARVTVAVAAGEVQRSIEVAAHGESSLVLGTATPDIPLELRLTIRGGFPASQLRPGDSRNLGVRLTFDDTPGGTTR